MATDNMEEEDKSTCRKIVDTIKRDWVLIFTFVGIVVGFIIGLAIRPSEPSDDALMWIGMPGDIFLRLLKLIIIPLIVASIISGTASSDPKANGKITGIALGYICITNLFGCIIGLILGAAIKPGEGVGNDDTNTRKLSSDLETQDMIADLIRNIFPENIFQATIQKSQTMYEAKETIVGNDTIVDLSRTVKYVNSSNLLGIVFVTLVFGVATGFAREKGRPFLLFFTSLTDVIMIVINWFMWTSPLGIASLIAKTIGGIDDLQDAFIRLGVLIGSVTGGCAFHQIILIPLIVFIFARKNPFPIVFKAAKPWLMGFATTSQAVSTPAVFESCDKLGVDKRVAAVSVPLAVTLNRDGSALFVCISCLFLAQMSQISATAGETVIVGIVTWVAALSLPAIPMASLVTIVIVCGTVGIPVEHIGLLFAVDWFQDRVRSSSNVLSTTMGAYIVNQLCKSDIKRMDDKLKEQEKFETQSNDIKFYKEYPNGYSPDTQVTKI